MNEKKQNKTQMVLSHLQTYGYITSWEAIEKYKATRLSDIIYRLRNRGIKIQTIDIPFVDSCGTKSEYGKYVLIEE
jgi:ribosomal protein S8